MEDTFRCENCGMQITVPGLCFMCKEHKPISPLERLNSGIKSALRDFKFETGVNVKSIDVTVNGLEIHFDFSKS